MTLDLLMPGVGLYYWERKARGSRLVVMWVAYVMGALALWLWRPFHSDVLTLWIALPWGGLTLWLWREVSVTQGAELSWLRRSERLSSSLALVCLAWLPIGLTIELISSRVTLFVRVQDHSMFPSLLRGDLVAVDRRTSVLDELKPGALLAVECKGQGPVLMRLQAVAGTRERSFKLNELGGLTELTEPKESGSSGLTAQEPRAAQEREAIEAGLRLLDQLLAHYMDQSDELEAWLLSLPLWAPEERDLILSSLWSRSSGESLPSHLVAAPRYQEAPLRAIHFTLPRAQVLMMPDLRDVGSRAMRCAGPSPVSRVLGQALYVQGQDRDAYARRRGLSLLP